MTETPVALTIAGSDSGGGAGIQADLKTFSAFHAFGTSVITCVTAQNPDAVMGIAAIDPAMVTLQIKAVVDGFPVAAAKTGMLYSVEIIRAVVAAITAHHITPLVVDPVMISTSGARLLAEDAVQCLCANLLPLARVITPNLPEAEVLCGHDIDSVNSLEEAARQIGDRFGTACILKGGHLMGNDVVDVLYDRGQFHSFTSQRIACAETHGTGCTFSAALTALLARGDALPQAAGGAKEFVTRALATALTTGAHHPLNVAGDA